MNYSDFCVALDPGHDSTTPGKCSPDGKFREYAWNRKFARILGDKLMKLGFTVRYTVDPDDRDNYYSLSYRANRANELIAKRGHGCLISLHVNACGSDGKWHTARGWSLFTTKKENNSDILGQYIINYACSALPSFGIKIRKYMNSYLKMDFEENFTVLEKSRYPAVLIEHLFQDNQDDVKLLNDDEVLDTMSDIMLWSNRIRKREI